MCCTKCKNSETVSNKTLPLVILEMQWSHFQWSYEIIEAFYFHFISTYWTLFIPCDQDKTMGNTKAVDDLVTQGTRASAAMVSRLHEINLCVFHEKLCQPHAAFQSCWMILKTNAWFVLKISRCDSSILKCFFLMAAIKIIAIKQKQMGLLYPRPTKLEGGYTGFTLSVRLSVCPSVCRRHGFRSISQVCVGISISNFICMLMVAIGRSLLIFSVVTFKMAAWRPYWIFWFPDSNFSLALNIKFKLQGHNTYVYG